MLTIRHLQVQTLARSSREQFVDAMLTQLYRYFPTVSWLLTREELRLQVYALIDRAAMYQLTSQRQVCRYINLAATYGWEFDRDPGRGWMREILTDTGLPQASDRLERLVRTCLHRQHLEEQNQALRRRLSLIPSPTSNTPVLAPGSDCAVRHFTNTPRTAAITEEIIVRNPLSYHRSQSLWHSPEAVVADCLGPTVLSWAVNTPALLRRKPEGHNGTE